MDSGIISVRYAKALLLYATENREEDRVYAEMSALAEQFLQLPALQHALLNPVLSDEQKQSILVKAACGNAEPTISFFRFVSLLVKRGRTASMMFVANSYGTLYRKMKHIIKGRLVVAAAINPQVVSKFQNVVESRSDCKVDFQVVEDPTLGGGFILEYDTYSLDASVKTQLAKLKRILAK